MLPTTRVWLVNGTETQVWPVFDWDSSLKVTQDKYGPQSCDLTIRRDSRIGQLAVGAPAATVYLDYALWVFHGTTLLFSGPCLNPVLKGGGDTFSAFVDLTFHGHMNAALLRRMALTSNLGDIAVAVPTAPNTVAITVIDNAMGVIAGPIYPTGYPGGVLRTNFGPNVYRAGVAVGAPAPVLFNEQGGNNLQDVIEELCQKFNMCPAMRRTAAATRYIDVEYPYEKNDRTGTVVLTRRRGTAAGFEMSVPYTLTTVGRLAGAGSGAGQTQAWATAGVPTYGGHENQFTLPGAGAAASVQDAADMMRASSPLIPYKVVARDTSQVQWCRDYFWRDGVLVYDPDYGQTVDQTIVGYDYTSWNSGRAWQVELTLAERDASMLRHMAGRTGSPVYKGSGTRFLDNRG